MRNFVQDIDGEKSPSSPPPPPRDIHKSPSRDN